MSSRLPALAAIGLVLAGCQQPAVPDHHHDPSASLSAEERQLAERSALRDQPDPALRPEARRLIEAMRAGQQPGGRSPTAVTEPPATIRVWRRSLGGTDSCAGQVDTVPLETYVKRVLPYEWISSWHVESLKAGAVAARTYGAYWVLAGGKYKCADICDTTYSQVYKDKGLPVTDAAVEATAGEVLLRNGAVLMAEYSAENGDPTKSGVSDPVCAGKAISGHGRGMCQWGTQHWAQQGKEYRWMALHYYPGATFFPAVPNQPGDSGTVYRPDGGTPSSDSGSAQQTEPPPELQQPPLANDNEPGAVTGGCSVAAATGGSASGLTLVLVLAGLLAGVAMITRRRAPGSAGKRPLR